MKHLTSILLMILFATFTFAAEDDSGGDDDNGGSDSGTETTEETTETETEGTEDSTPEHTVASLNTRLTVVEDAFLDQDCIKLAPRYHPDEEICFPGRFDPATNGWRVQDAVDHGGWYFRGWGADTDSLRTEASITLHTTSNKGEYTLSLSYSHYHRDGTTSRRETKFWSADHGYSPLTLDQAEDIISAFVDGYKIATGSPLSCSEYVRTYTMTAPTGITVTGGAVTLAEAIYFHPPSESGNSLCDR